MNSLKILSSTVLLTACALAQARFGAMQGSVTAEDGAPMAGAVVSYSRITRLVGPAARARPAPGEAIVRSRISSDTNGAFAVSNLPAGEYVLCAEVPGARFLDPCKWSSSPKLTVVAGAVHRPAVVLKKGVFLKIRVNDPGGLLPPVKNDPSRAPNLIIGVVFGNGAFLAAEITRADQSGRDHQMSIPAGVPLKLWVFSRHVTLTDSKGLPVDNSGGRVPFQALTGQDQVFTLNVSGRDPQAPQED
ncbi:MAG: carboxypeptidase regulatory-like domain-containing protein [Acidobacteria bacterium]|nr:carboxypeptidase regulatory-like domain-containing protein [Acidobacteriota bacterium]